MKKAPLPENEELRLRDLISHDILNSVQEKEFDALVELAAQICDCPMAAISFVDRNRQWFKASAGLRAKETTRDIAFCAHTILQDTLFIVENAAKDPRFFDSPLVTQDPFQQFYAGSPIVSSAGYRLGAVCVMDTKPSRLSHAQEKALSHISCQISSLLELRLKNILIKKQAQKLLEIEQKTIKQNLLERDNERQRIGHQLEEEFAQVLTSVSHYLSIAQKNHDLMVSCVEKSKDQVDHLLNNIHSLSKSIVPTTLRSASLQEMLMDYVFRFQQIVPFKIRLSIAEQEEIRGTVAFSLFRIVETQLSIISGKKKVQHVFITLSVEESRVIIKVTDDGMINRSTDLELMMNTIIKRVDMHDGSFSIENDDKEGGSLMVILPLG